MGAKAELEAVKRPKDIIIKGKELMREADRDEDTLVSLENNLRKLELIESKEQDPWKLITNPTINNIPIAPKRKNILLFSFIGSLLIGSLISYLKERLSDFIYDESDLERVFSVPIINKLILENKFQDLSSNQLRLNELIDLYSNKLNFIIITSGLEENRLNEIKLYFNNIFTKEAQIFSTDEDLNRINNKNTSILITSLGVLKFKEANIFKKRLKILNIKSEGIVLL